MRQRLLDCHDHSLQYCALHVLQALRYFPREKALFPLAQSSALFVSALFRLFYRMHIALNYPTIHTHLAYFKTSMIIVKTGLRMRISAFENTQTLEGLCSRVASPESPTTCLPQLA